MDVLRFIFYYFCIRIWILIGQVVAVGYVLYVLMKGCLPSTIITIVCIMAELVCCCAFTVCSNMLDKKYRLSDIDED